MINSQLPYAVMEWEHQLELAARQRRTPSEPRWVESADLPPAPPPQPPAWAFRTLSRGTPRQALSAYEYEPGCCD